MPQIDVLAEDNSLVSFCLKIVMKLGIQTNRKKIFVEPVPRKDAGFTWVHRKYPQLIKRHRARATSTSVAFVVGIDSDKKTFAERASEFDKKLEVQGMPKRQDDEQIVLVIPKRNIETWVKYFTGPVDDRKNVDEDTDYKKVFKKPDFETTAKGFVEEFRQWKQQAETFNTLPALVETFKELDRVMA